MRVRSASVGVGVAGAATGLAGASVGSADFAIEGTEAGFAATGASAGADAAAGVAATGADPSITYVTVRGPNTSLMMGSTTLLVSSRPSILMANDDPLGNDTVSVDPSSAVARALCNSAPREACLATTRRTASDHLRCRSPASAEGADDADVTSLPTGAAAETSGVGADSADTAEEGAAEATGAATGTAEAEVGDVDVAAADSAHAGPAVGAAARFAPEASVGVAALIWADAPPAASCAAERVLGTAAVAAPSRGGILTPPAGATAV